MSRRRHATRLGIVITANSAGGVQHFLLRLLDAFDPGRVRPHMLLAGRGRPTIRFFRDGGWPVSTMRDGGADDVGAVRRWIAAHAIDVVMTSCFRPAAAVACRLDGVPHIWRCPGKPDVALSDRSPHVRREFVRCMSMLSERLVVNSRTVADALEGLVGTAPIIIPNGIGPHPRTRASYDLRRRFAWPARDPVVAMIAHLVPVKRHADFIEAAALVRARSARCRFLIFGDVYAGGGRGGYAYRRDLRRRRDSLGLRDHLAFVHGEVDLAGFLRQIDIVAHPCPDESLPNAVLEAMAARRPIVAANGGGCAELIADGRTGVLVPPARPDRLAASILRLLSHPEEGRRLGRAAWGHVRRHYDIHATATRYADLIDAVARSSRRKSAAAGE